MAVVVILGIIAGVAGAAVTGSFGKAKENSDKASEAVIREAVQRYIVENSVDSTKYNEIDIGDLVTGRVLADYPQASSGQYYTVAVAADGVVTVATSTTNPKPNKP